MSLKTPTQRTLAELRTRGIFWKAARTVKGELHPAAVGINGTCEIVERWVSFPSPGHRKDLFGFADILVTLATGGTLAIQACAGGSAAERLAKVDAEPRARVCLDAGWAVEVWAWAKTKRAAGWELRRLPLRGSLAALPAPLVVDTSRSRASRGGSRLLPAPAPQS